MLKLDYLMTLPNASVSPSCSKVIVTKSIIESLKTKAFPVNNRGKSAGICGKSI